jgi:hypothetical protein
MTTRLPSPRFGLPLLALMSSLWSGCWLYPATVHYASDLTPVQGDRASGYELGNENRISYYLEGSRIDVRYLSDRDLNEQFPDDSQDDKLSTNPYTYGNWVDPNLGYIPNRFTVFEVAVYNYTLPKMMLDPAKAVLLTDRGDLLETYTVAPVANRKSLEGYYRALRRISGNEYYRFAKRIGIVRSSLYSEGEIIFKGEHYSGFLVFDPLHPKVEKVQLVLKQFATNFDAFNRPTQTIEIPFHFTHKVEEQLVREGLPTAALPGTKVIIHGPQEITGNQLGDLARDVGAINSVVSENLADLNRCFAGEYEKTQALEGELVVEFSIMPNGEVAVVTVRQSTVANELVEQCVLQEIDGWRFQPAGRFADESVSRPQSETTSALSQPQTSQHDVPLSTVTVVYPFQFTASK